MTEFLIGVAASVVGGLILMAIVFIWNKLFS